MCQQLEFYPLINFDRSSILCHQAAEIRVGTGRTGRDGQAGQVEKSGSMASLIAIGWHPADQQTATLCQGFGNDHRDT
jgi:hypothetical protein